jgi:hypothetical protein
MKVRIVGAVWIIAGTVALGSCWPFESEYTAWCVDAGICLPDGGQPPDAGNPDGGDAGNVATPCPDGGPTGNGWCLIDRYSRLAPIEGVWAESPSYAMFGGTDEAMSIYVSGAMTHTVTGLSSPPNDLGALDGRSSTEIWAAIRPYYFNDSYVYRYDGAYWSNVIAQPSSLSFGECSGVWAARPGTAMVACENGLWQVSNDGDAGLKLSGNSGINGFYGVWGLPNGVGWAVGGEGMSSDAWIGTGQPGGAWTMQVFSSSNTLRAVHGRNDRDVWAVGDTSAVFHLDDAGWRKVTATVGSVSMNDVWVGATGDVWITANDNRVYRIRPDGGQSSFIPPGLPVLGETVWFQQIQVLDNGDVWITARTDDGGTYINGAIFHYAQQ